MTHPILVTGAAGRIGGVGGAVIEALRRRGLPARALVRRDDERAAGLRADGAEVVSATSPAPRTSPAPWRAAGGCTSG